jgi:hypothetical protein
MSHPRRHRTSPSSPASLHRVVLVVDGSPGPRCELDRPQPTPSNPSRSGKSIRWSMHERRSLFLIASVFWYAPILQSVEVEVSLQAVGTQCARVTRLSRVALWSCTQTWWTAYGGNIHLAAPPSRFFSLKVAAHLGWTGGGGGQAQAAAHSLQGGPPELDAGSRARGAPRVLTPPSLGAPFAPRARQPHLHHAPRARLVALRALQQAPPSSRSLDALPRHASLFLCLSKLFRWFNDHFDVLIAHPCFPATHGWFDRHGAPLLMDFFPD